MKSNKRLSRIHANSIKFSLVGIAVITVLSGCGGSGGASQSPGTNAYAITDLGSFSPRSINDHGTILGSISAGENVGSQPEIWQNGTTKPLGIAGTSPSTINNLGTVTAIRYITTSSSNTAKAGILSESGFQDLNLPANVSSFPNEINSSGTIAGNFETDRVPTPTTGPDFQDHAFSYANNKATELPPLNGDDGAKALGINDLNQLVGFSMHSQYISPNNYEHAVIWNKGVPTDLGTLGGKNSSAGAINDNGVVIGISEYSNAVTDQWTSQHGFQWKNGKMTELPPLIAGQGSYPLAINNQGTIVGYSVSDSTHQTATMWVNGHAIDINTLIPTGSGYVLTLAADINASGQIIVAGTHNGATANLLLTPKN